MYVSYLFLVLSAACLVLLVIRPNLGVRALLNQWADENHLVLAKAERRYLSQGPFTWRYRSGVVFRIEVQPSEGTIRRGWIRLAYDPFRRESWSKVVVWDDEKAARTG